MSALIRCDRCRRRLRNATPDCTWNVVMERGNIIGHICPNCQTAEENAEAEINDATLDYLGRVPGVGFLARTKGGDR